MNYKVIFLYHAEQDLLEIKKYLIKSFNVKTWHLSYLKIKDTINILKTFPLSGDTPPELEALHLSQYRQVISGVNRIIYEVRLNSIYIHVICDVRRDIISLLTRRLLRTNSHLPA